MKGTQGIGTCAAVVLLFSAAATFADAAPSPKLDDFAYRIPLSVPAATDGRLVRFDLTPTVYRNSTHADLGDMRVFNAAGVALPYSISNPATTPSAIPPTAVDWYPLPVSATPADLQRVILDARQGSAHLDVTAAQPAAVSAGYLLDLAKTAHDGVYPMLDYLTLDWAPVQGGEDAIVNVEASDDLNRWSVVGASRLVQLDYMGHELRQDRIELSGAQAHYLRLTWQGGATPLALRTALVSPWPMLGQPPLRVAMSLAAAPAQADPHDFVFDAGNSIDVEQVNFGPLSEGTLVLAGIWMRNDPTQPWHQVASGSFYHVLQGDADVYSAPLRLPFAERARYWMVRTDPRSSDMLTNRPALEIAWTPRQVVFLAQAPGPYVLAFGNPRVTDASLSLEALVPGYLKDPAAGLLNTVYTRLPASTLPSGPGEPATHPVAIAAAEATLTAVNPAALAPVPEPSLWQDWKTWLAWSLLCAGVLLLGWMAWRLIRQMREPM